MKRLFCVTLLLCFHSLLKAQNQYEVVADDKAKVLKGIINAQLLRNDTAFSWFKQNLDQYNPDPALADSLKSKSGKIQFVVFGGTWCEDTQNILPRFYKLVALAGFPEEEITLLGVDRNKKTIGNLSSAFHVTHVPTFIVLLNGKELGRVVEYGKTGMPEKELIELLYGIQ